MRERDEVDQNSGAVHRRDLARILRLAVVVVLVGAVVLVALDNRSDARVGYVFGDATAPMWLIVVAAAVSGAIIGWLLRHSSRRRT